jgi:hypothetical protein
LKTSWTTPLASYSVYSPTFSSLPAPKPSTSPNPKIVLRPPKEQDPRKRKQRYLRKRTMKLNPLISILMHHNHLTSLTTVSTPTNKRMFSGGSFSTSSTETTPVKISHPEAHTQALQNCLVETLMYRLWLGGAKIKWAEGRSMYLDYRPYIPTHLHP